MATVKRLPKTSGTNRYNSGYQVILVHPNVGAQGLRPHLCTSSYEKCYLAVDASIRTNALFGDVPPEEFHRRRRSTGTSLQIHSVLTVLAVAILGEQDDIKQTMLTL
jgi:hypothetical protein